MFHFDRRVHFPVTLLLSFLTIAPFLSASAEPVPDFTLNVFHDLFHAQKIWQLQLMPPAHHHFNIKAPLSAENFKATQVSESEIVFENSVAAENTPVTVSVFLCDDAKTYCVKKTKKIQLQATQSGMLLQNEKTSKKTSPSIQKNSKADSFSKSSKKDAHGFWDNDFEAAFQESMKTKKPMLIDFYGIWCPPCNMYVETVFPTAQFKKAAKNFVLLKMDTDSERSWPLKSHFKIGGYPTLVFVKAVKTSDIQSLEEIDRVVGFYATSELTPQMNDAYGHRLLSLEEQVAAKKTDYLEKLKKLISSRFEQKDFKVAGELAEEGKKANPSDLFFSMISLQVKAEANDQSVKSPETILVLKSIRENRKSASSETLLNAEGFILGNAEALSAQLLWVKDLLDTLAERVNPINLSVEGVELSIADLDSMRVDLAEALKDEVAMGRARKQAIASDLKIMALYPKVDLRGMNLELAYLYWTDGQLALAKEIFDRLIKKYPHEFTFYYASAKMYLDTAKGDREVLKIARERAEKAYSFSYGDNRLRAMERLIRVMDAQGESGEAKKRGEELLAQVKDSRGFQVRTDRYVKAIQKLIVAPTK